ncbi:MAG: DNA polymerase III subunit chi [Xanthomonadales bacterium]|nr:DNA polymerase III subunit chi [Xanthomonadales bacterium]
MTVQADFYLLDRPGLELESVLCTLVRKAWTAGFKTSILVKDAEQAKKLDEALWQDSGFLAHEILSTEKHSQAPTSLVTTAKHLQPLVINLSSQPLQAFNKLQRVLEIVPNQASLRQQSRDHYRNYQQLGWQLKMHKIR